MLGPRTINSYMVGCTAGLLACELGLHTLEGVGEALLEMGLVCGLPTLAGKLTEGSIVKQFRETGSITYLPLVMGGATAAGISLSTLTHGYYYSFLANRYIGRLADIYEKSLKLEKLPAGGERYVVAKRRFFTFLSRDMLESLVNDELRAAYGDQILSYAKTDPTVKLQLLRMAEKDPDAVAAIKFLCEAGKCGEAVRIASKGLKEAHSALLTRYVEELLNRAEGKLFSEYLGRKTFVKSIESLLAKPGVKVEDYFLLPAEVVNGTRKNAWRMILEDVKNGRFQFPSKELKNAVIKALEIQIESLNPSASLKNPASAEFIARLAGTDVETAKRVVEPLDRVASQIMNNNYKIYMSRVLKMVEEGKLDPRLFYRAGFYGPEVTEEGAKAIREEAERVAPKAAEEAAEKAKAALREVRSKIRDIVKAGSIRKVNEALEQELDNVEVGEGRTGASLVEDEMRTAERYAKEAEDMEKIRKKVSMRRKLAAGLVCSGAGYLVGTLSAAAIGTITPTIPKLTITIDTQTNTIKVGDLRIGG